jgi:hypothetical protein
MNVIERALELRGQAIAILLAERGRIDEHLAQLGHGQMPGKKRGRPAKLPQTPETSYAK